MEKVNPNENGAMVIGELMGENMRPAPGGDMELLKTVAHHALQLRGDQQMILNKLIMASHHWAMNNDGRQAIAIFVEEYQTLKRFHDTKDYIIYALDSLSLKKFWSPNDAMKGNIQKIQQ